MLKKWIKLAQPSMVLNAPNVTNKFQMKYSPTIPWDWSAHKITAEVPAGVRHLVFNCHGYASRPNFPAPHLSLGTVFHPGNVSAFDRLRSIYDLRVIWISACNIASSAAGVDFCREIAKRSICYVVSHIIGVPDWAGRANHIEDYSYCMPTYIDMEGHNMSRSSFFALSGELGFSRV